MNKSSDDVTIEQKLFGETSAGDKVHMCTLTNQHGMSVSVISLGAAVQAINVPGKDGTTVDVTPGFTTAKGYEINGPYFGAMIGRYANRIDAGKFSIGNQEYQLNVNNGPNHLHGGIKGFSHNHWTMAVNHPTVECVYVSSDKEEHYPGELTAKVTYELTNQNELICRILATTTKPTPVNMTGHSYFNLAGHTAANIYDHKITVFTNKFTPKSESGIPTGEIASVKGTQYDLTTPVCLGDRVNEIADDLGYDHNFCFGKTGEQKHVACLEHEASGRVLDVYTDQPGLQVYTGNYISEQVDCKDGSTYGKHSSTALEPQNYPNAVNQKNFPDCILKPGDNYERTWIYKFSTHTS